MNHPGGHLVAVLVAQRIKRLIDTGGEETRYKLGFHSIEADRSRLVELGGLLFFVFHQKKGIDIVLQLCVEAVIVGTWMLDIVCNSAIHVGMADRISYIMAEKAAHKGQPLLSLLAGINAGQLEKAAAEKIIHMMLMHIGADIPMVSVAQDGQIIKKHIRPLKTQLIQPAVLGNNKFQIVLRHVIVRLHA